MEKERIECIIVTHNRREMLYECLQKLINQTYSIEKIFIIDNASLDNTLEYLKQKKILLKERKLNENEFSYLTSNNYTEVYYYLSYKNLGGAGGFNMGLKKALNYNFSWIWLMDDDAEPKEDTLEKLLSFEEKNNTSFLAPLVVNKFSNEVEFRMHKLKIDIFKINEKYINPNEKLDFTYKLEANSFVGPLLNVNAIKKTGLIDESYFILYDDTDFTYRLYKNFGPGYLITQSIIYHKDSADNKIPKWKKLYGMRNQIRFFKKYVNIIGFLVLFVKSFLKFIIYLRKFELADLFRALFLELFIGNISLDPEIIDKYQSYL